MTTPLTKEYLDEQFDSLARAVKEGFDHASGERAGMKQDIAELRTDVAELKTDMAELKTDMAELKTDMADLKYRMRMMESEVQALSANMVTKQYLDAKIDQFIYARQQDSLFKQRLLLALEEAHVLKPDMRAKLETLIPAIPLNE